MLFKTQECILWLVLGVPQTWPGESGKAVTHAQEVERGGPPSRKRLCVSPHPSLHPEHTHLCLEQGICTCECLEMALLGYVQMVGEGVSGVFPSPLLASPQEVAADAAGGCRGL